MGAGIGNRAGDDEAKKTAEVQRWPGKGGWRLPTPSSLDSHPRLTARASWAKQIEGNLSNASTLDAVVGGKASETRASLLRLMLMVVDNLAGSASSSWVRSYSKQKQPQQHNTPCATLSWWRSQL